MFFAKVFYQMNVCSKHNLPLATSSILNWKHWKWRHLWSLCLVHNGTPIKKKTNEFHMPWLSKQCSKILKFLTSSFSHCDTSHQYESSDSHGKSQAAKVLSCWWHWAWPCNASVTTKSFVTVDSVKLEKCITELNFENAQCALINASWKFINFAMR